MKTNSGKTYTGTHHGYLAHSKSKKPLKVCILNLLNVLLQISKSSQVKKQWQKMVSKMSDVLKNQDVNMLIIALALGAAVRISAGGNVSLMMLCVTGSD